MSLSKYRILIAAVVMLSSQLAYSDSSTSDTSTSDTSTSDTSNIGASLHEKYDLAINEIPDGILKVIHETRSQLDITGAEKEYKNGNTYIDVETVDTNGNELEFDMLFENGDWKIIEIQRDLSFNELPNIVKDTFLKQHNKIKPSRIIESDQGNETVIYEFFLVSENGDESKKEIKLADGKAQFLKEEWKH